MKLLCWLRRRIKIVVLAVLLTFSGLNLAKNTDAEGEGHEPNVDLPLNPLKIPFHLGIRISLFCYLP